MRAGEICQISPSEVSIGRAPFVAEVPAPAGSPSIQGDDDMAQYLLSVWHDEDFDLDELPDDVVRRVVASEPTLLLHEGKFLHAAMRRERVHEDEVRQALRKNGVGDPTGARAVVLESDGTFSVIAGKQ
jgi:hypothetical protein